MPHEIKILRSFQAPPNAVFRIINRDGVLPRHRCVLLYPVLLVAVNKLGRLESHRAENLLGIALAPGGDLRALIAGSPGLMQSRALPKRSLVGEDNYRPFGLGVLLRFV
jgi:hypothetical protein